MGLFSTKKKHVVNTTVSRVIEDSKLPASAKTATVASIIKNDSQLVENILDDLISGIGSKAHSMYRYAGNGYYFGRPSAQNITSNYGLELVTDKIKELFGSTAEIEYYQFGPLNNLHDGWVNLVNVYQYNSFTNQLTWLSNQKETPVYLKDMVVVLTPQSMNQASLTGLEQWGTPPNGGVNLTNLIDLSRYVKHTPIQMDMSADYDSVLVTYQYERPTGVKDETEIVEESFSMPFNFGAADEDYFQVKYTVDYSTEEEGVIGKIAGYWTYKEGDDTYLDLDTLFNTEALPYGSYFPFTYFRYEKQSAATYKNTAEYKSSKKLVKYIGLDYEAVIEAIHENPDIGNVEQAMMMMAIPANTDDQMDQRYLFDFFKRASQYFGITEILNFKSMPRDRYVSGAPPKRSWVVQDTRFKMVIGCDSVYTRKRAGVIGDIDAYASEYKSVEHEVTYTDGSVDEDGELIERVMTINLPTYFYRHQLSLDVYEEIEVVNIKSFYHVWGDLTSVGDEDDPTILIPLDYSITNDYSLPDRELLYARSLHFVFNSHEIIKIKWYQTGFFKLLMVAVAIIITVMTYGATWQATIAAAVAAGTTAVATMVFMAILKYVVVAFVAKLFVKAVGAKFALLVAVVAFVIGAYQAIDAGSVAGAPWAQELLSISSNLTSGIGDFIKEGMIGLQKEAQLFSEYVKEQTKLLEDTKKLLDAPVSLSPFVIFGETPNDFYNRTVHSGNIGVIGIEAVTSYVDIALTLPSLSDTLGSY